MKPGRLGTTNAQKKSRPIGRLIKDRRRPTLPGGCPPSTIGAERLNGSVRNGKRCFPLAISPPKRFETAPVELENRTMPGKKQENPSSPRRISTGLLIALLRLHSRPIDLVVYQASYSLKGDGRAHLEAGFALRCFQRLSVPRVANQRCPWQDNWYTRGAFIPVLSY